LAIGLAAVNTGNNLLYLILSLVLALAGLSAAASTWSLRRLRVTALLPEEAVRGEPFLIGVEVSGRFPLLPQTWVEIHLDGLPEPVELTVAVPSDRRRGVGSARAVIPRRGIFGGLTLRAATGYPLDLWLRRAGSLPWRGSLLVLPRHRRIAWLRILGSGRSAGEADSRSRLGGRAGTDLHNIRPYTTSDDARHIDWRSSARSGRLMVKEFEREQERRIDVVLDLEADDDVAFEEAVERCAAILDLARRESFDTRLLVPGAGAGLAGRDAMRRLAGVRPVRRAQAGPDRGDLAEALRLARRGAEVVVISADPARATPIEMA
jgi:uncharacterized protein (DUF58 family)